MLRTIVVLLALVLSPPAELAAQTSGPALPSNAGKILVDYFHLDLASACRRVPDPAWTADARRRITDHMTRLHGLNGMSALVGIMQLSAELQLDRTALTWGGDAPRGECARDDWPALIARVESYRADRTLNTPRRR